MSVRFGLNLLVYTGAFTKDDLDVVRHVADLGYDGVEIPFVDLDCIDVNGTRQVLAETGLGMTACCVMTDDANPCSPDAAERRAAAARLMRMIDMTAEVGGDVVAGPLYSPVRHLTGRACTADEWQRCAEVLAQAAAHAEGTGIRLAIEPLNRFETYVINTVADAARMCRQVGSPNLGIQVDTFHANIEEKNTAAALREGAEFVTHFHASESDRGIPGTGQVHWDEVFPALQAIGYDGWITIESFAAGIVDLCAAACIWRPIYPSADRLARDGLSFLQQSVRRK